MDPPTPQEERLACGLPLLTPAAPGPVAIPRRWQTPQGLVLFGGSASRCVWPPGLFCARGRRPRRRSKLTPRSRRAVTSGTLLRRGVRLHSRSRGGAPACQAAWGAPRLQEDSVAKGYHLANDSLLWMGSRGEVVAKESSGERISHRAHKFSGHRLPVHEHDRSRADLNRDRWIQSPEC